jgi:hypothetical protein
MFMEDNRQNFEVWLSTYGLLTAERILDYFSIKLSHDEMFKLLGDSNHSLYCLIDVPLRNIFNGIICQQAYDYQVYAQKLMIDYRLSPEYAKEPDAPGANVREDLNDQYERLVEIAKSFSDQQYRHYQLISETQAYLIEFVNSVDNIMLLEENKDFSSAVEGFRERAKEMMDIFKGYRQELYDMILAISERLANLPDYKFDVAQAEKQREALFFDKEIGE